jgi:hypothetical protein
MAGPQKMTQEEYDDFRSKMEEKYGYDDMSDEEKERFDKTMDQVAVVDENKDAEDTENTEDDDMEETEDLDRDEREIEHKGRDDDDENIR